MNTLSLKSIAQNNRSLGFDDVNLISNRPQNVESRESIDPSAIEKRLIVAPMAAIQTQEFVYECGHIGIQVALHRFCSVDDQLSLFGDYCQGQADSGSSRNKNNLPWISVGLTDYKERLAPFLQSVVFDSYAKVLVDVANGFSPSVRSVVADLVSNYNIQPQNIMVGNFHAPEGLRYFDEIAPQSLKRIGIGNGAACTTTVNTGIGRGQVSAIMECRFPSGKSTDMDRSSQIVSDGGIKTPGDVAKAFGLGASYVMAGRIFADADEASATSYFGGASATQKALTHQRQKFIEGTTISLVDHKKKALTRIVSEIVQGVQSAISYSGFSSIEDYIGNGEFDLV